MDFKRYLQETHKQGTKMTKDKLLELIRKTNDRDFPFVSEPSSKYILVRVPLS